MKIGETTRLGDNDNTATAMIDDERDEVLSGSGADFIPRDEGLAVGTWQAVEES